MKMRDKNAVVVEGRDVGRWHNEVVTGEGAAKGKAAGTTVRRRDPAAAEKRNVRSAEKTILPIVLGRRFLALLKRKFHCHWRARCCCF